MEGLRDQSRDRLKTVTLGAAGRFVDGLSQLS
jgi:hypothetical protein